MLNSVSIMGRLTAAPELRKTQSDLSVTSFTIANDQGFGDKKKAHFIGVVAWRQTAEFICKHFSKGQMIAVSGKLQTRSYEDKEGKKHTITEILADAVFFCGDKPKEQSDNPASNDDFEVVLTDEDLPF